MTDDIKKSFKEPSNLTNSKILLLLLRRTGLFWVVYSIIQKIQATSPLLVDGKFVSDVCEKANLFNNLFSSMCTPIQNTSILPSFLHGTNDRITSFHVTKEDILLIIKTLDSSKAYGWVNHCSFKDSISTIVEKLGISWSMEKSEYNSCT